MAAAMHHQLPIAANPPQGLGFPAQAQSQPPRAFRVQGRHPQLENGDICGEYCFVRNHSGKPMYQNRMTGIVIRFFGGRWLMDRGGIRHSDVCVAFAPQIPNCLHPALPELVWHVWDSKLLSHVEDPAVFCLDAPEELVFVGRHHDCDNAIVNGRYSLLTTCAYGRAVYKHQKDALVICYNPEEHRWTISDERDFNLGRNVCTAWADAVGSALHPGDASLQWQFFEPERGSFQCDPCTGLVNAPETVSVIGRHPQAENARINGTYHLAGVHSGRPLYIQPGTQAVIRYSPKNNWWLIDCDGLAKPSLMSRLYQWVLTGNSETASDLCSAWANARHTEHPSIELEWNVWEGSSHKPDKSVAVTAAPLFVCVSGRDVNRENADINGEYQLQRGYQGHAAYSKPGTQYTIYFSKHGRWVVDRHGFADTGVCAAHVEGDSRSDFPTSLQTWHVHETARGAFVPDPAVEFSVVHCELPAALPLSDPHEAMWGELPDPSVACRGVKRGVYGMEGDYGYNMEQDYASQHAKFARTANQGGSGWLSIFGA